MASPAQTSSSIALWQHPFVDIFKYVASTRMETMIRGEVDQIIDKHIRKNVYRLRGRIAASNYIRIPKELNMTPNMHLTGRFVYIELRKIQSDSTTFHLEIVTRKKSMLRLTFSSMYSSIRSMGVNLRVPLRLYDKWTILALDMYQLLDYHTSVAYNREGYDALKTIMLCSTMYIRGIFTSDIIYLPETLPKAMQFPLVKPSDGSMSTNTWDAVYDWQWLPQRPSQPDSPVFDDDQKDKKNLIRSPSLALELESAQSVSPSKTLSPTSPLVHFTTESNSNDKMEQMQIHRTTMLSKADSILQKAGIHRQSPAKVQKNQKLQVSSGVHSTKKYSTLTAFGKNTTTWPSPIATLDRVIGFSILSRDALVWGHDSSTFIFASESNLIVGHRQESTISNEILVGHTDDICAIAYSRTSRTIASAQNGQSPCIRLWYLSTTPNIKSNYLKTIKAHPHGVVTISFSSNGTQLCGVGYDAKKRTQILIWDVSSLEPHTIPPIIAKQLCDYVITKMKFVPFDNDRLISCGKESIRFWRVKANHLPACPVILHEYARDNNFTDFDFDPVETMNQRHRPVYVASSQGTVLIVDYDTMLLSCVYKLHDGPVRCLRVNEGFCITGSDDGYVRVWPLDFSDFYLEAQHDVSVASIDMSCDGLFALIGCINGSIGILDISKQHYTTVVRSHTQDITALIFNPEGNAVISAAEDGTVRIWDVLTGIQTYEFKTDAIPTCLAHHPSKDTLAVGFTTGILRIFQISSMEILETYQQHHGSVVDVVYGRSACYSTGIDQQLCCYQGNTPTVHMISCNYPPHAGYFYLHLRLKLLAITGDSSLSIEIRDMYSLRQLRAISHKGHPLGLLGFVRELVAATDACQRLLLFCSTSGNLLRVYPSLCSGPMGQLALTSSGRYAITGQRNQSILQVIMLESAQQLRAIQVFPGQARGLKTVCLSSDCRRIASCGFGTGINIWTYHGPNEEEEIEKDKENNSDPTTEDLDESLLYEKLESLNQQEDDDLDTPNSIVPTPMQPPSMKRDVLPSTDTMQCVVQRKIGWNMKSNATVLWSSKFSILMFASGCEILIEVTSEAQRCIQHHQNDISSLVLSNDEEFMASLDTSQIALWQLPSFDLRGMFSWPGLCELATACFHPQDKYVLGIALINGLSNLFVWDSDTLDLVATIQLDDSTPQQAVWIHGDDLSFCTNSPFQSWKVDAMTIQPIARSIEVEASYMQTSSILPQDIMLYHNHVVSFYNITSQTVSGVYPLLKKHIVRHLHWIGNYLILATGTASFFWIYTVCPTTMSLQLYTSTTADDLEVHALRVNDPVTSMSWSKNGQGLVLTNTGALWYIDAESHTKQLIRRIHSTAIEAAATSSRLLGTISCSTIRLWDVRSLHEIASLTLHQHKFTCLDLNSSGIVVAGLDNGMFRVYDSALQQLHDGACPWLDISTSKQPLAPVYAVQCLGDSSSFLIANKFGHCSLWHTPTKQLERISLPFGALHMNVLSSQNDIKVGGQLVALESCGVSTWLTLWQSTSGKCYANVYTNMTTNQDAWELVKTPLESACAVFSRYMEVSIALTTSNGFIEGRNYEKREVVFRCIIERLPSAMTAIDDGILCEVDDSLHVLNPDQEALYKVDHSLPLDRNTSCLSIDGSMILIVHNRIEMYSLRKSIIDKE